MPAAPMKAEMILVDAEIKAAFVHCAHDRSKKAWYQWVPFHNVHPEPPPAVENAPPAAAEPVLHECSALVRSGGSRTFHCCDRPRQRPGESRRARARSSSSGARHTARAPTHRPEPCHHYFLHVVILKKNNISN